MAEYGSLGSVDGYGGGYQTAIDCNSALGIIGLLGLIELLRDTVQFITRAATVRKRRGLSVLSLVPEDVGDYLAMEMPLDLMDTLPGILIPTLNGVVDANDNFLPSPCMERVMCEANAALMKKGNYTTWDDGSQSGFFGFSDTVRGLVSKFLSEVLAKGFTDGDAYRLESALKAASSGREGSFCWNLYGDCHLPQKYFPVPELR